MTIIKNMFKKILLSLIAIASSLVVMSGTANAFGSYINITNLPEYTRTNDFEISYSALTEGSINVHFCYKKEGESFQKFGPDIDTHNGKVQVTSSQMDEEFKKYYFKAFLNGSDCSGGMNEETSVIFDKSGPSPVSDYRKEKVNDSYYRLHWRTPPESDFSRVFVYRSEDTHFTADNSKKVGEHGGAPDTEVSWDNFGMDPNKTYYFAVRAVDKAGNPSDIVADPETIVVITGEAATSVSHEESGVEQLPEEEAEEEKTGSIAGGTSDSQLPTGQVLAEETVFEAEPVMEASPVEEQEDETFIDTVRSVGFLRMALYGLMAAAVIWVSYSLLKRIGKGADSY
jgi:hypothetical protein